MDKKKADEVLMWSFVKEIKRRQEEAPFILSRNNIRKAMNGAIKIIESQNDSQSKQEAKKNGI